MHCIGFSLAVFAAASAIFALDIPSAKSESILDWETITVVNETGITSCYVPASTDNCLNEYSIHGKDIATGKSKKIASFPIETFSLNPKGISEKNGSIYFNTTQIQNGNEEEMVYSMNLTTLEFGKVKDGRLVDGELIFTPTSFGGTGDSNECTQVGSGDGSILVCPPGSNKPKGIYLDSKPLIGTTTDGEIHIGENSLITIEENGVQKLYAKDAEGNAIPINITEGSKLLIDGIEVTPADGEQVEANRQSISTNADNIETNRQNISTNADNIETNRQNISTNANNIETNRKNINDLGYGVAGATALTAALSSLPTAANDAPFSCGIGTGGYSSRFAMGLGCAARLNERLSLNVGGSHVFGGSSDYGAGSLDTVAARGGFVFNLGTIHKPAASNELQLPSKVQELERRNAAIEEQNKSLIARLERLEAITLEQQTEVTAVRLK